MISFYPGPSRVYDGIPRFVKEANDKGILSLNHRSPEFEGIAETTVGLLKEKLKIPASYSIFFASSATECWEIIAQSLVVSESIHIYNGAFGEKWFDYTHRIRPEAKAVSFDRETQLAPTTLAYSSGEVICLTQNETSNGTQVSSAIISTIRKNNPQHLIAVDATSSMAGIALNYSAADIWFASVQKCFGLPAGLSVMALSPRAIERIRSINETNHYNSLSLMDQMMIKWQTPCTPNVLGIYLLMRVLKIRPSMKSVHDETIERSSAWQALLKKSAVLHPLIQNVAVRSNTVIAVQSESIPIEQIKKEATRNGFLLGEGYGALKKDTFRIANFPALKQSEVNKLMRFLRKI